MKNYTYQNNLIGKKQLRQLLAWSFTHYDSMQASALADELKYLGFKYSSQAGISISIEDLKIPFVKNLMLEKANKEIINTEKIYLKGKITEVERFQKIIDTWSLTSESLKEQVIYYFKTYDPLNSVYIMAFSGARGNLSQVRQLVGMRGLMSDPSGEIMKLPIKKNFREGLTITDYLMSGYGARKGIVDTALKTANSGYLTRRLIDVGQDILIREKDCLTTSSFFFSTDIESDRKIMDSVYEKILGRVLNQPIFDLETKNIVAKSSTQITPNLIKLCKKKQIQTFYIRSPLTCNLYRAICQKCYGWDLANENLVDIGEAIGILAGQSIGEPGTQLTMRTFHTGGIFTSEARHQVISPINGIVRFHKMLKTILIRTNKGEDVSITKNSGSLILIPENKTETLLQIKVLKNTILFPKNNQYVLKDTVLGEVINTNKQIKTEIKPILSNTCGEIFMPRLTLTNNLYNNNKLIWILSGQLYNSPVNSFINFYPDYKLTQHSHIFRTKILNNYQGYVEILNAKENLYQRLIQISNKNYSLLNSTLQQLTKNIKKKNYLLTFQAFKYLIKLKLKNFKYYISLTRTEQIGTLVTNVFRTVTGGTLYYDQRNIFNSNKVNQIIVYLIAGKLDKSRINSMNKRRVINLYKKGTITLHEVTTWLQKEIYSFSSHKTITWLGEEIYKVNCDPNILLVEHGDFICEGFELTPRIVSKTSGIVILRQKNNIVQTISIKGGLVYECKKFKDVSKKMYYPGEIILSNILVEHLAFCEHIVGKATEQLLIRPIEIYEFPHLVLDSKNLQIQFDANSAIKLESKAIYSYTTNKIIKGSKNLNLISNVLIFKSNKFLNKDSNLELFRNPKTKSIDLQISKKVYLNNYLLPYLRYKSIQSSLLLQENQFVDMYSILGYMEAVTVNSLEIVKFKLKIKESKQILLISNEDCVLLKKNKFPNKKINEFIIASPNLNETGKIIIENANFFTLQKGRPYFFPNCKNEGLTNKANLQYKKIPITRMTPRFETKRDILLNYYNLLKFSVTKNSIFNKSLKTKSLMKAEFSKFFLKKKGKLYSLLVPKFFQKFTLNNFSLSLNSHEIISSDKFTESDLGKPSRTLLLQSSEIIKNHYKSEVKSDYQLTLIKFLASPFTKINKSIGLYSITEDYFEDEVNNVFCKNNEFIENGETIGLLKLEKEITGDIVQGLPRIEEILEARKKKITIKRIPTSQKKRLLIQKTSLDPNFEFRKVGTAVKENEKINPHKLLKVYFNYYGLIKFFVCDQTKRIKYSRLVENYEGSYKSFKKVQSFIVNSVQSVYQSQGVSINDKHLEIIIKQMTTKVLITYEGNTPLLRREVIDLYHIKYINEIIYTQGKQSACYVPLLLGITKAALNNPSFISAASFQETTRVLTKAAIEGRIDWLRGLKENIIIGHLIPAGTGSQNYRNCFKKILSNKQ
jgi:DNA-directed RNA polymerase subunit beta'